MKTTLPNRSLKIKQRLERITQEILAVAGTEIAMIILFGSYARGDWVMDSYVKDHTTYSYESDLDIMVVTKSSKFSGSKGSWLEQKIKDRLERAGLGWRPFFHPGVSPIVETIQRVNKELEKSKYFFSDIKKEGIVLYDSGEFSLAEARDLNWKERKEMARDYYDQWFEDGSAFLILAKVSKELAESSMRNKLFNKAAFLLHQATESLYTTILLVFTGYKPRSHDIEKLGSLAKNYSNELLAIFPRDTKELDDCFTLLQKAYTDARYEKDYKITEEQLLYLIERVEKLKLVTEEICLAWINKPVA